MARRRGEKLMLVYRQNLVEVVRWFDVGFLEGLEPYGFSEEWRLYPVFFCLFVRLPGQMDLIPLQRSGGFEYHGRFIKRPEPGSLSLILWDWLSREDTR
jgi:hypothetical protein